MNRHEIKHLLDGFKSGEYSEEYTIQVIDGTIINPLKIIEIDKVKNIINDIKICQENINNNSITKTSHKIDRKLFWDNHNLFKNEFRKFEVEMLEEPNEKFLVNIILHIPIIK